MKKLFGLMAAAALATTAGLAIAEEGAQQQPQQGAGQPQQGAGQQQQGMQQHKQQQQHAQRAQKMEQAGIGRHEVTGRIVDIDKQKGDIKVQTDRGQLDFYFPPASLQNYNQGDEVRLDVVLRPAQQQPKQQPKQQQQK